MSRLQGAPRRPAFTLIELLIVIAIIAILASLLLAAVIGLFSRGYDVAARDEITQLGNQVQQFKTRFGFYPPSKLKLANFRSAYGNAPLDQESIAILNRMFPKLSAAAGDFDDMVNPNARGIPWVDGNLANVSRGWSAILEGDQCFVFCLGGIADLSQATPRLTGFSNNPLNPAIPGNANERIGPFYEFKASRLYKRNGSAFLSYKDYYGEMPYVYFSSGRAENGYDERHRIFDVTLSRDAANNPLPIGPYHEPLPRGAGGTPVMNARRSYHARKTFQIISAGEDKTFNAGAAYPNPPGGPAILFEWTEKGGVPGSWDQVQNDPVTRKGGKDDVVSFHGNRLGYP